MTREYYDWQVFAPGEYQIFGENRYIIAKLKDALFVVTEWTLGRVYGDEDCFPDNKNIGYSKREMSSRIITGD